MKLEVVSVIPKIEILGLLEPVTESLQREVYLDGKRAPPTLERLILLGLDVETEQYCRDVEDVIKLHQKLQQGD